jgi:hypothetical protein
MGRACSKHRKEKCRCLNGGNLKGREIFRDLGLDQWVLLKWIIKGKTCVRV